MRTRRILALGALLLTAAIPAAPTKSPATRPLSYTELGQYIRGLQGKVVVVDFWADY